MQRHRYIVIERLGVTNPYEVIDMDRVGGSMAISAHQTRREAIAAIKRYTAADQRRAH